MQNRKWYIGCSGFYYKEWKEIFYPKGLPQKEWFEYYCRHYNTLEINNTFYRFPQLKNLESWHKRSPSDFIFSIKVPGTVTHYKQFKETEELLKDFYAITKDGLAQKLGPILFQLPPKFSYSEEKLDAILLQLDYTFLNVIEFRHNSWWREDVIAKLAAKGVVFCGVSFPGISNDEVIINNKNCYYRFHGTPKLFYSAYDENFLQNIYSQIQRNDDVKTAFVYFNNTASAAALGNSKFVQELAKETT